MNIIISYPDIDGLDKAEIAYSALKKRKYNPWYFEGNVTLGHLYFEELTYRIRKWCDVFLYLCTQSSRSCSGQRWEVAQALKRWTSITILAVPLDNAVVPLTIDVFAYHRSLSSQNFEKEFEEIAKDFINVLAKYRRFDRELLGS